MNRKFLALSALASLAVASPLAAQAFGSDVAVGTDHIIVGEPDYPNRSGVVYVFGRDGSGTWSQTQMIQPGDASAGNNFGTSVAVDGDIMMASAPHAGAGAGAVYVYRNSGGTWMEAGQLVPGDATAADTLGAEISINGNWAMISSLAKNQARGVVYAFRRDGDNWVEHSQIAATDLEAGNRFGEVIEVSGDHMMVAAGGIGDGQGAVYHFTYDEGQDVWAPQGALEAPLLGPGAAFGSSISIVDETALIGVPGFLNAIGSVQVYELTDNGFEITSLLAPFETQGGSAFGSSIAYDGQTAWIGAPGGGAGQGRSYVFTRSEDGSEWGAAEQLGGGHTGQALFAATVDMAGDLAVGGAVGSDRGAGSGVVFERTADGWAAAGSIEGEVLGMDGVMGDEVRCSDEGEAAAFTCESVDLLSFLPVSDMGANRGMSTNDVWGWTDPDSGREIVLVGMSDQTAFVDITNPGNPVYLGRLPMPETANASVWRDMKVYANHMYVVSDGAAEHGMQVFDLTHLRDLDGSNPVTFEADAHYTEIASAHNIVINEETGYAYSVGSSGGGETCGGGLHMINIQDPKNPTFAGCFQDMTTGRQRTGYSHDAQCVVYHGPDEDYQGREICLGSNETALSIADVTDKSNPVAVSMASYPNVAYSHQGWLSEDHAYFFMGDELDETGGNVTNTRTLIWDLADLDDPVLAQEYMSDTKSTDHNLYILGNTMYQSNYKSGLRVLDVSDPENPVPVGNFDTVPYGGDDAQMTGSWSNYPYFESGVVVVTSGREGLFIVRYRPRTISQ
ncbi:MAG: choice-of-anchor B family protein [Gemmatimonadota bacterium]